MASYPAEECCAAGVRHEGTPKGEIKTFDGIRAYEIYPDDRSTQNAVLIMTDVLGFEFPNVQLPARTKPASIPFILTDYSIADRFAARGYYTIIPDVFKGAEIPFPRPEGFSFPEWKEKKMPREGDVDPIYASIIRYLRVQLGVKRLGGVGYCFGGKYVCRWLKPAGLDAAFTAHPSFVEVDELRGIQGPLSIAAAETDEIFPADKRRETENILKEMSVPYQITLHSDVEHGFGVRGDRTDRRTRFAKEQAFLQAVFWFDEFIKE